LKIAGLDHVGISIKVIVAPVLAYVSLQAEKYHRNVAG
jgi:hypothetical protein